MHFGVLFTATTATISCNIFMSQETQFESYWLKERVQEGLKRKSLIQVKMMLLELLCSRFGFRLVFVQFLSRLNQSSDWHILQGALRINAKNYEDAYVPHPDGISDVYIKGVTHRNRALNGDIVAVLILGDESSDVSSTCWHEFVAFHKVTMQYVNRIA